MIKYTNCNQHNKVRESYYCLICEEIRNYKIMDLGKYPTTSIQIEKLK